jgi:hypothetical protein
VALEDRRDTRAVRRRRPGRRAELLSEDRRSLLVGLTPDGLARLRDAQVTHHRVVRERLLSRLDERDLKHLGRLWEKAMPGVLSSPVWPI